MGTLERLSKYEEGVYEDYVRGVPQNADCLEVAVLCRTRAFLLSARSWKALLVCARGLKIMGNRMM